MARIYGFSILGIHDIQAYGSDTLLVIHRCIFDMADNRQTETYTREFSNNSDAFISATTLPMAAKL